MFHGFSGIHFVDGAMGRRAAVVGTGLDVSEVVAVAKDNGGSAADTSAYREIDPRLVESALRYDGADRDEVDSWIESVDALNERGRSPEAIVRARLDLGGFKPFLTRGRTCRASAIQPLRRRAAVECDAQGASHLRLNRRTSTWPVPLHPGRSDETPTSAASISTWRP